MSICSFIQDFLLVTSLLRKSRSSSLEGAKPNGLPVRRQLGILIAEPRQVRRAACLARWLSSEYEVCAIAIGTGTYRAIEGGEEIWNSIEKINIQLTEEGMAEEVASQFARGLVEELRKLPFPHRLLAFTGNELFTKSLLPLVKICSQLKHVVERRGTHTLILLGGNRRVSYSPVFYAEGERAFPLLHYRSWLVNPHIYQQYSSEISVEWQQTLRQHCAIIIRLRRLIVYGMRVAGVLRNWFLHGGIPKREQGPSEKSHLLPIFVRSEPQFRLARSLYRFLEHETCLQPVLILGHTNMDQRYVRSNGEFMFVSALRSLNVGRLLSVLLASCRGFAFLPRISLEKRWIRLASQELSMEVDLRSILKELSILLPDVLVRHDGVRKTLHTLKQDMPMEAVVTTELLAYGGGLQKLALDHELGRSMLYVLQGVGIARIPYPFWWGDVYLLTSKDFEQYAQTRGLQEEARFRYVGDFVECYKNQSNATAQAGVKRIVLFTQPDDYSWLFKEIAQRLCQIMEEWGNQVDLTVKLHPRDRCERYYKKLRKRYGFIKVTRDGDPFILCQEASLAVTSTSAVLQDAYRSGVPTIAFVPGDVVNTPKFVRRLATCVVTNMGEFQEAVDDLMNLTGEDGRGDTSRHQCGLSPSKSSCRQSGHPCRLIADLLVPTEEKQRNTMTDSDSTTGEGD